MWLGKLTMFDVTLMGSEPNTQFNHNQEESKQTLTDSRHYKSVKRTSNQLPFHQTGDHSAKQDPPNTVFSTTVGLNQFCSGKLFETYQVVS